ncbi:hypothetical protein EW146_g2268 [Bondarzewia mesenterica]|uniref:Uncharacterized protein n=1 Tax=Bondarzewia mesenterica TaxID=1095465 RepID=A0A4S4M185_9AGAM|nr:hypothetical protein EW146_g2268 [Bondarzewia mesenterica]
MSLEPGSLDDKEYRTAIRNAIDEAQIEELPQEGNEVKNGDSAVKKRSRKNKGEGKGAKTSSLLETGQCRWGGFDKEFKDGLQVKNSDGDEEMAPLSPKMKKLDVNEVDDGDKPAPKVKTTKSRLPRASSEESAAPLPKAEPTDLKPSSSSSELTDNGASSMKDEDKSGSEMSVLVDVAPKKSRKRKNAQKDDRTEKPKQKRGKKSSEILSKDEQMIARLKVTILLDKFIRIFLSTNKQSFIIACGLRKAWSKEFRGLDTPSQKISRLRKILEDLGMVGRYSMEQAKAIKEKRELAKELADVQQFEQTVVSGVPFRTRSSRTDDKRKSNDDAKETDDADDTDSLSDREAPTKQKNTARRSIMAFLQDQSDED